MLTLKLACLRWATCTLYLNFWSLSLHFTLRFPSLLLSNIISLNLTQLKKERKKVGTRSLNREVGRMVTHSCIHSHSTIINSSLSLSLSIYSFQTNNWLYLTFFDCCVCSFWKGRNHHHNFHCIVPKFLAPVLFQSLRLKHRNEREICIPRILSILSLSLSLALSGLVSRTSWFNHTTNQK